MRCRPCIWVLILLISCLFLPPILSAKQGLTFDEWLRRDQESMREFQQKQLPSSLPDAPRAPSADPVDEPALDDHAAAALIPDGDEQESVVQPASATNAVGEDAGWAMGLGRDPGKLLDAMEGGRPGGDVSAMLALLRQMQGPFTEAEEQALMKKYAPYAVTGSARARAGIRKQNELLFRAMVYRQMMVQAAWEYDFALAEAELGRLMEDKMAQEEAEMLADIQRQMVGLEQKLLEAVVAESASAAQIPPLEELKAEEDAERENAIAALELPAIPDDGKVLLGYLKYEETFCEKAERDESLLPEAERASIEVNENFATFSQTRRVCEGSGSTEPFWDTKIVKYRCAWEVPQLIPLYGYKSNPILGGGRGDPVVGGVENKIGLKVTLADEGSKLHGNDDSMSIVVGIGEWSTADVSQKPGTSTFWGTKCNTHLMITIGEPINIAGFHGYPPWGNGDYVQGGALTSYRFDTPLGDDRYVYFCIIDQYRSGAWAVYMRYKWDPVDGTEPAPATPDTDLAAEKNEAIAEHQANIAASQRVLEHILEEQAAETDPRRREELRLQALHVKQDIHDCKDLIASIRTGDIVKTRGPWDEHNAIVLAETSLKLRQDCLRAQQMQASYLKLLKDLQRRNPEEANKFADNMADAVIRGILEPGGFERAKKALYALHASTKQAAREALEAEYADQAVAYAEQAAAESSLRFVENVKWSCDWAVMGGSIFMSMGAGIGLSMAYEAATTSVEAGPGQALENALVQGAVMVGAFAVMQAGSWGIGKLLNSKVAQSEVNSLRYVIDASRYESELAANKALVQKLKERIAAFEKCKISGGKDYLKIRAQLDEAIGAVNSSSLAKRCMKNELTMLQNEIKSGATRDYTKLRECIGYQKVFDSRLHKSIYPRADAEMVRYLRSQGYNVDAKWFREFRNACSRGGVNADRDLGLIAKLEASVTKNGKPVLLSQVMEDGQKGYNMGYRKVTGHSATLADQNITTSASDEAFPLSWLEKKASGPFTTLDPPVTPADFEKAGNAIYNKVKNAMAGPDPHFVNLKKASASLSKDLKSKVFKRLTNPPPTSTVPATSRKAALEHWKKVEKVLSDLASDTKDPLTAMRELQRLTGSSSITESAAEVRRLVNRLGGVK